MNAIEIRGLTKSFRGMYALDGLDMTVPIGAIYGFISENGSGKSTTEKLICGQDFPRKVMKSAMLKVDRVYLENAIEQIKQTANVHNYEVIYQHLVQLSQWQELQ